MTHAEYEIAFIATLDRMDPTGLIPPFIRAHLLAKSEQEVLRWDGSGISELAEKQNNLFGMNAVEGRPFVEYAGNQIDQDQGRARVRYCIYPDWESSIRHALTHLFSSGHYIGAYLEFLWLAEKKWATNPAHAREVGEKFILRAVEISPSSSRDAMYRAAYSNWVKEHSEKKAGQQPAPGGIA